MFIDHNEIITKQELQPLSENTSICEKLHIGSQRFLNPIRSVLQQNCSQTALKAERIHSVTVSPGETSEGPQNDRR